MFCGYPGYFDNGRIFGFQFTYKSVLRFRSNSSYDLVGDDKTTCEADGQWSKPKPRCRANCGHPGVLEHGRIIGDVFLANGQVHFECDSGYFLSPDIKNSTCTERSASWSPPIPKCQLVSCGYPGDLHNGVIYGSRYTYLSVLRFQCNRGYDLVGDDKAICQGNGQWNKRKPRCRDKNAEVVYLVLPPGTPGDCTKAKSFGELFRCYSNGREEKLDLECAIVSSSSNYKVICNQVHLIGREKLSWQCQGVRLRVDILCCDYKCHV